MSPAAKAAADLSEATLHLGPAIDRMLAVDPDDRPRLWEAMGVVRDLRARQLDAQERMLGSIVLALPVPISGDDERPCGHRPEDACEACVAETFDLPGGAA